MSSSPRRLYATTEPLAGISHAIFMVNEEVSDMEEEAAAASEAARPSPPGAAEPSWESAALLRPPRPVPAARLPAQAAGAPAFRLPV